MGSRNHELDESQDPWKRAILGVDVTLRCLLSEKIRLVRCGLSSNFFDHLFPYAIGIMTMTMKTNATCMRWSPS